VIKSSSIAVSLPSIGLVAQLAKLPGIGEKTAQRLAFYVMRGAADYARSLGRRAQRRWSTRCDCARGVFRSPTAGRFAVRFLY